MDSKIFYKKLATVPSDIRIWLGSDAISDYIDKFNYKFSLPEGSSATVKELGQELIIKDIAPEYFSGELATALSLEKDTAVRITSEIKKTIFSPIEKDLANYGINIALLDNFQMPGAAPASNSQKIIRDINSSVVPTITPLPVNKMAPPVTTSDIGWSKAQPSAPTAKLNIPQGPVQQAPVRPTPPPVRPTIQQAPPAARPPIAQTPAPASVMPPARPAVTPPPTQPAPQSPAKPSTPAPTDRSVSEFARLKITPRSPLTGPSTSPAPAPTIVRPVATVPPPQVATVPAQPTKPVAAAVQSAQPAKTAAGTAIDPPPVMLHEDTKFTAAEKNAGFTLARPGGGAQISLNTTQSKPVARPAVLEFGGTPSAPKPSAPNPVPPQKQNYSEFKRSLSSAPTENSGPRNVSQILPPAPVPPAPPTPPASQISVPVPRPPQKPTPPPQAPQPPQKEKVITKNFL